MDVAVVDIDEAFHATLVAYSADVLVNATFGYLHKIGHLGYLPVIVRAFQHGIFAFGGFRKAVLGYAASLGGIYNGVGGPKPVGGRLVAVKVDNGSWASPLLGANQHL